VPRGLLHHVHAPAPVDDAHVHGALRARQRGGHLGARARTLAAHVHVAPAHDEEHLAVDLAVPAEERPPLRLGGGERRGQQRHAEEEGGARDARGDRRTMQRHEDLSGARPARRTEPPADARRAARGVERARRATCAPGCSAVEQGIDGARGRGVAHARMTAHASPGSTTSCERATAGGC
jgi:hypothetical protein